MEEGIRLAYFPGNCTEWNANGSNGTTSCSERSDGGNWSLDSVSAGGGAVEAVRPWQVVFFGILAAYMSLLTVVGNLIVILSFIVERSIRQTSNYFIASLAVSDLLIGCVSMPLYTVYLLSGQHWPLGEVLCDLWLSLDYTLCLCSIYTVFCITIDRYCSVTIPAKYHKWRTERKVFVIVAVTWIVPVIVFFTSIIGWQYFVAHRSVPSGKCYVQYMESALFNCLLQVGYFWLTLSVMVGLYAGIYRVALRLHRRSETRRKKMTSLVSMAGQTITKIGIGVTGHQKKQDAAAEAAEAAAMGMQMLQISKGTANDLCQEESTTRNLGGTYLDFVAIDDWPEVKGHELSKTLDQSENSTAGIKCMAPGLVLENHFDAGTRPKGVASADEAHGLAEVRKCSTKTDVNNSAFMGLLQPIVTRESSPSQMINRLHRPSFARTIRDRHNPSDSDEDHSSKADEPNEHLHMVEHMQGETTPPLAAESAKRRKGRDAMRGSLPSEAIHLLGIGGDVTWSNREDGKCVKNGSRESTRHCQPLSDVDEDIDWRKETKPTAAAAAATTSTTAVDDGGLASPTLQDSSLFFANYPAAAAAVAQTSCESDCPEQTHLLAPPSSSPGPSSCGDATSFCRGGSGVSLMPSDGERRRKSRFLASRKWSSRKRAEKRRQLGRHGCGGGPGDAVGADGDGMGEECQQYQSRQKHENRAKKSLRTITLILGAFVICWTPWHIMSLIMGFCSADSEAASECFPPILYDISYWLCYINSPLNPFCYAFANQQFKKTFVRILRLDWHRT